jgi:predicted transcriptional regulator
MERIHFTAPDGTKSALDQIAAQHRRTRSAQICTLLAIESELAKHRAACRRGPRLERKTK